MNVQNWRISSLGHVLHRRLLTLIVLSYALAATAPAAGLLIKETRVNLGVAPTAIVTLPQLLLSLLLVCAGVRVRGERVWQIAHRPGPLLIGLLANLAIPLVYLVLLMPALRGWHSASEAGTILIGLALVASMPVAGSSAGWAQNSGGDMTLSLGLVIASTLLSPLTTPIALRIVGWFSPPGDADELHVLAGATTASFLILWVLFPSLLGIAFGRLLGHARVTKIERWLKLFSSITLLVLCYTNASACLPRALGVPDWDFLALTSVFVMGLCAVTFATGHILGHLIGADREQRAALTFGLGMSNNGTGLVLASVVLASRPLVMLPIIVYNLTQHVVAGGVHSLLRRSELTGQSRVLARINRNAHVAQTNSSYSVTRRMSQ
jgi:BASS family bile acid:Na+ symporter